VRRGPLAAAIALGVALPVHAFSPAVDYAIHCQGCHLADGTGTPGSGVPALAGSVGRFPGVPGGREYLIRVPGVSQSALDDTALAALLNWVVQHFDAADLPADFAPYTAEEIGRTRRPPLTDVEGTRKGLVRAMGSTDRR